MREGRAKKSLVEERSLVCQRKSWRRRLWELTEGGTRGRESSGTAVGVSRRRDREVEKRSESDLARGEEEESRGLEGG
jgi:hypothetical protein